MQLLIDRRERDVLEHCHRVGANDRLTVWSILFSGSIFYPKPKYVHMMGKEGRMAATPSVWSSMLPLNVALALPPSLLASLRLSAKAETVLAA